MSMKVGLPVNVLISVRQKPRRKPSGSSTCHISATGMTNMSDLQMLALQTACKCWQCLGGSVTVVKKNGTSVSAAHDCNAAQLTSVSSSRYMNAVCAPVLATTKAFSAFEVRVQLCHSHLSAEDLDLQHCSITGRQAACAPFAVAFSTTARCSHTSAKGSAVVLTACHTPHTLARGYRQKRSRFSTLPGSSVTMHTSTCV